MEEHQSRPFPYFLDYVSLCSQPRHYPIRRDQQTLSEIFHALNVTVKPFCTTCGHPFISEKYGLPDNASRCPQCRHANSPNLGEICDCGQKSIIVVEITIRDDSDPRMNKREFMPLCFSCGLDEIAIRLRKRKPIP